MRLFIESINQFKLKQHFLWVGVSTLVTVIIWIGYAIYSAYFSANVDPDVLSLTKPLNPALDQETLDQLQEYYQPPQDYTILVKKIVGTESYVAPLGSAFTISDSDTDANVSTQSASY